MWDQSFPFIGALIALAGTYLMWSRRDWGWLTHPRIIGIAFLVLFLLFLATMVCSWQG